MGVENLYSMERSLYHSITFLLAVQVRLQAPYLALENVVPQLRSGMP